MVSPPLKVGYIGLPEAYEKKFGVDVRVQLMPVMHAPLPCMPYGPSMMLGYSGLPTA